MAACVRHFMQSVPKVYAKVHARTYLTYFVSSGWGTSFLSRGPLHSTIPPGLTCSRWLHNHKTSDNQLQSIEYGSQKALQDRSRHAFSTSTATQYEEEDDCTALDVVEAVNSQLQSPDHGRLFAIVHIDRHQRKVTTEDLIEIDYHVEADVGEMIRLNKVLLLGGKDFTLVGRPVLSANMVRVDAMVIEKTLSPDQVSFWYRRRKRYRRFKVNKIMRTVLRIKNIEVTPLARTG